MRNGRSALSKLQLKDGDIVVLTTDNPDRIGTLVKTGAKLRAQGYPVPDCPILWLRPGETIDTLSADRFEQIARHLGYSKDCGYRHIDEQIDVDIHEAPP